MVSIFLLQLAFFKDDLRHAQIIIVVEIGLRACALLQHCAYLLSYLFIYLQNRCRGRRLFWFLLPLLLATEDQRALHIAEPELKAVVEVRRHFRRFVGDRGRPGIYNGRIEVDPLQSAL